MERAFRREMARVSEPTMEDIEKAWHEIVIGPEKDIEFVEVENEAKD